MGYEKVQEFLAQRGFKGTVTVLEESTATVELAAAALGVEPGRIAKTLAFAQTDGYAVIVVCGTARIDNKKYKATFGCKAKMLSIEETLEATGHPVGGVCPFALPDGVKVYLDQSLRSYDVVHPAAGAQNASVPLTVAELEQLSGGQWVDVCQSN